MSPRNTTFLVIGGGIAGVSCAETISYLCPNQSICLITESSLIKTVTNLVPLAKNLFKFDIIEKNIHDIENKTVNVIMDRVVHINSLDKYVTTVNNHQIHYQYLCLCTGARPNILNEENAKISKYIIGIRDTESVNEFQKRITSSRKIMIVGNGGIASEIAYEIKGIQVDWIIKDDYITSTFLDPGAAHFLQSKIKKDPSTPEKTTIKRMRYQDDGNSVSKVKGAALGPDWHRMFDISGNLKDVPDAVKIHYKEEIGTIVENESNSEFPIKVELKNSKSWIDTDFIVSATGVIPDCNFTCDQEFKLGTDGGIFVDWDMQTSIESIYAAGDVCFAGWEKSKNWFQMRLWTQARQMGMMAGKSMAAKFNKEEIYQDFCFELFGHVTKLYGYQVVLLGKYNGQGLDNQYEILLRLTPDKEYIKFILVNGKLEGAILIGETGLEETCENLILNEIDLTPYGEDLLNPDIDIEDYFD